MSAGYGGIARGIPILLLAATPMLIYRATQDSAPPWLVYAVATAQIAAITWCLTGRWPIRHRVAAEMGIFVAVAAVFVLPGLPIRIAALVAAAGCHTVAYAGLLIWFAASLRQGREPVVTGFARRIRQGMPEKVVRYTRQVTIAWCIFFASQLVTSAVLLTLAPPSVWSAFITLLNLPLLTAMVLGEFGYRMILFRHEPHSSLSETLSAWRHVRASPPGGQ